MTIKAATRKDGSAADIRIPTILDCRGRNCTMANYPDVPSPNGLVPTDPFDLDSLRVTNLDEITVEKVSRFSPSRSASSRLNLDVSGR
jgi:hypothetical protein